MAHNQNAPANAELAAWQARGTIVPTSAGDAFAVDIPAHTDHGLDPMLVLHGFPSCSADWRHVVGTLAADLALTFLRSYPATADELALQWAAVSYADGQRLLPRTMRYIEDRRARESRYTGAIERHASPLGVVWGMRDPVAVPAMVDSLL